MITQTDRLILRKYTTDDLEDLFAYLSDENVVNFEPYKAMSLDEVRAELDWRISSDEMISVELKENHKMIGNVFLGKRDFDSLEIRYVFNSNHWGRGYAKEGCKALIDMAFLNGAHRVFAECDPRNRHSWKLLEALGFHREAHFRKNVYFWTDENENPIWKDTYVYALLNNRPINSDFEV